MKRISADGSVGSPHVRVGHCQVPIRETRLTAGFLFYIEAIVLYVCKLTEFSEVDIHQFYAVNATANRFFLAAIAIRYHLTDMSAHRVATNHIPNSEVKRISADR